MAVPQDLAFSGEKCPPDEPIPGKLPAPTAREFHIGTRPDVKPLIVLVTMAAKPDPALPGNNPPPVNATHPTGKFSCP